jgi:23S rRNA pseudouridine2605 synthase
MDVRLQKILSAAGIASRRAAEKLMVEGRVSVNGATVLDLGAKADPDRDDIRVDGSRVKGRERPRYLLLNKPRGFVTTRSDPERRPTVLTLLKAVREYVYPVGRLDFDTEGLLILTNDGDLAKHLTHPSHEVERVYEARVFGVPDTRALDRLARGVMIDGQRTAAGKVRLLTVVPDARRDHAIIEIVIHEGRNRQVRRMFEAVGHRVLGLRRTRIGPIIDPRLPPGGYRDLSPRELTALRHAAGIVDEASSAKPSRAKPSSAKPSSAAPPRRSHDADRTRRKTKTEPA